MLESTGASDIKVSVKTPETAKIGLGMEFPQNLTGSSVFSVPSLNLLKNKLKSHCELKQCHMQTPQRVFASFLERTYMV